MESPQNVEYERRVLGFALRNTEAREQVVAKLRPEDFYDADNAVVFRVVRSKAEAGEYLDSELLVHELQTLPSGEKAQNKPLDLVMSLVESSASMTFPAVETYVSILRNLGKGRDLLQTGQRLATAGSMADGTPETITEALNQADTEIRDVIDRNVEASWEGLAGIVGDFNGNPALEPLFPSGLVDLDRLVEGGFRPGQLVTISGRPAMGKSTFAVSIAQHASINKGVPGLIVSLEMGKAEIGMRILASQGRVSLRNLQRNELTDQEMDAVESVRERFQESRPPLYVVDDLPPTFSEVRATIIAAYRRLNIKYVVIDYLQLMDGDSSMKNASRENIIGAISRGCKALARELGIVIFMVAQMNRESEKRTNHRPMVSDLRESGQIEQDSDMIMMLYRPEVYSPEDRPGEADLILGKHRNGQIGDVPLLFKGHISNFVSMVRDGYSESA